MKEKRSTKIISVFLYIIAAGVLALYIYCGVASYSPFMRAGLLAFGCALLYMGTYTSAKLKEAETAKKQMKITFFLMFLLYAFMLVTFLFFEGYFGRDSAYFEMEFSQYLQTSANFVPFKSTGSLIYGYCKGWIALSKPLINIGGNLVAFMPFALFLPMFIDKLKKAVPLLICVAVMVILVEATQLLLRRGVCDIDDLILNVGGAGLLWAILNIKPVRKLMDKLTFGLY